MSFKSIRFILNSSQYKFKLVQVWTILELDNCCFKLLQIQTFLGSYFLDFESLNFLVNLDRVLT